MKDSDMEKLQDVAESLRAVSTSASQAGAAILETAIAMIHASEAYNCYVTELPTEK